MTPDVLLQGLAGIGVELWRDGDKLRCRGPRRAITPELVEGLRRHKAEILEALERSEEPVPNLAPVSEPIRDAGEVLEMARARLGEMAPEHQQETPYPPAPPGRDPMAHKHTDKALYFAGARERELERRRRNGLPPWIRIVDGGGDAA